MHTDLALAFVPIYGMSEDDFNKLTASLDRLMSPALSKTLDQMSGVVSSYMSELVDRTSFYDEIAKIIDPILDAQAVRLGAIVQPYMTQLIDPSTLQQLAALASRAETPDSMLPQPQQVVDELGEEAAREWSTRAVVVLVLVVTAVAGGEYGYLRATAAQQALINHWINVFALVLGVVALTRSSGND